MKRNRYPGPVPYSKNDEVLFFGREKDKAELTNLILKNKLTVLFGRSGFGKSSLIQAGIIPHFRQGPEVSEQQSTASPSSKPVASALQERYSELNYHVIELRFQNFSHANNGLLPYLAASLKKDLRKLNTEVDKKADIFLQSIAPTDESITIWHLFKSIQWKAKQGKKKGLLVVLDQFEELFNFSPAEYEHLFYELSKLVFNAMPESFEIGLAQKLHDPEFCKDNQEAVDFLEQEFSTKFLLGIRSDRLYLLDELGEIIPIIFNTRYALKPLQTEQLESILTGPAQANPGKGQPPFDSPKFNYSPELITQIETFLKGPQEERAIEGLELQIICKNIEEEVIRRYQKNEFNAGDTVDNSFLPPEIDYTIRAYYKEALLGKESEVDETGQPIPKPFSEIEILLARYLFERKLIDQRAGSNVRVNVAKDSLPGFAIGEALTDRLLATKLLRSELTSVELSHDRLMGPILKNGLPKIDDQLEAFYKRVKKKIMAQGPSLKKAVRAIEKKLVDEKNTELKISATDLTWDEFGRMAARMLADESILIRKGNDDFVVNGVFYDTFLGIRKNKKEKWITKLTVYLIGAVTGFVISVILFVFSLYLSESENAKAVVQKVEVFDNFSDKAMVSLQLLHSINQIIPDDSLAKEKLLAQFGHASLYCNRVEQKGIKVWGHPLNNERLVLGFYQKAEEGPVSRIPTLMPIVSNPADLAIVYNREGVILDRSSGYFSGNLIMNYPDEAMLFKQDSVKIYHEKGRTEHYKLKITNKDFANTDAYYARDPASPLWIKEVVFLYRLSEDKVLGVFTIAGIGGSLYKRDDNYTAMIDLPTGRFQILGGGSCDNWNAALVDKEHRNIPYVQVTEKDIVTLLQNSDLQKIVAWPLRPRWCNSQRTVLVMRRIGAEMDRDEMSVLFPFSEINYLRAEDKVLLSGHKAAAILDYNQDQLNNSIPWGDTLRFANAGNFQDGFKVLYYYEPNWVGASLTQRLGLYNSTTKKRYLIDLPVPSITAAWFSNDGSKIFVNAQGRPSSLTVLAVSDDQLKVVNKLWGESFDPYYNFRRLTSFQTAGALFLVDIERLALNTTDQRQVSRWISNQDNLFEQHISKIAQKRKSLDFKSNFIHRILFKARRWWESMS